MSSDPGTIRPPVLRDLWPKLATALAVVGLIDLTHQLIEWAGLIHTIASEYTVVRTWIFSLLPFRIPPEWHDCIVLVCILFSVTNIGFYKKTGKIFPFQMLKSFVALLDDLSESAIRRDFPRLKHQIDGIAVFNRYERILWQVSLVMFIIYWTLYLIVGLTSVGLLFFGSASEYRLALPLPMRIPFVISSAVVIFFFLGGFLAWRWVLKTAALFLVLCVTNYFYIWFESSSP